MAQAAVTLDSFAIPDAPERVPTRPASSSSAQRRAAQVRAGLERQRQQAKQQQEAAQRSGGPVGQADKLALSLNEAICGPVWKYIQDDNITDVDFNGHELWLTDAQGRRIEVKNHGITPHWVDKFSQHVANIVSKPFSKKDNLLEAETPTLRISILHESAAVSGRTMCIRKSLPTVRITAPSMVETGYMPREIINLLSNCIKAKMNFVIVGEPGAGKDLEDDTIVPVPVSEAHPRGWARHGDLKVGDKVFAADGSVAEIDYVTGSRPINGYKVSFDDGQSIIASDTHLWRVVPSKSPWCPVDLPSTFAAKNRAHMYGTKAQALHDLANELAESRAAVTVRDFERITELDHEVCEQVGNMLDADGSNGTMMLDEALLLAADIIGDDCDTCVPFVNVTTKSMADDGEDGFKYWIPIGVPSEREKVAESVDPYEVGLAVAARYGAPDSRRFDADVEYRRGREVIDTNLDEFARLTLGSIDQRRALLAGFLDGWHELTVSHNQGVTIDEMDYDGLSAAVAALSRSLSIKTYTFDDTSRIIMMPTEPVFRYRELNAAAVCDVMLARYVCVSNIESVKQYTGQCIHIDNPEHLYQVGGYLVTHNTEAAKFFTQFVPNEQRVITIEDSPEWHFREINPGHDCVEMRVNEDFDYADAIKTCLRQNPKWIMLSEVRSIEAKYLIEAWSTGVNGVTTLHTDDIRKVPSRLLNMMASRDDADRLEGDIYEFVNVAFLVRRKQLLDGTSKRYVDQVGFFVAGRDGRASSVHMLIHNGQMVSDELPPDIAFRLARAGVERPFESADIDAMMGNEFHYESLAERQEREAREAEEAAKLKAEREAREAAEREKREREARLGIRRAKSAATRSL